jgi:hydrogenase maturation protease
MSAIENNGRVLVLGYGNPLRGDDAVGWHAAQRLKEMVDPKRVMTMAVHSLLPELADPISGMDLVIFIDAAENEAPGHVSRISIAPSEGSVSMMHHLTPERLLDLTNRLYGRCPRAFLITVGGEDFGHREALSEIVEEACDRLVEDVREMLGEMSHA